MVGDVVTFFAQVARTGRTSITVDVEVYATRNPTRKVTVKVTEATLTTSPSARTGGRASFPRRGSAGPSRPLGALRVMRATATPRPVPSAGWPHLRTTKSAYFRCSLRCGAGRPRAEKEPTTAPSGHDSPEKRGEDDEDPELPPPSRCGRRRRHVARARREQAFATGSS